MLLELLSKKVNTINGSSFRPIRFKSFEHPFVGVTYSYRSDYIYSNIVPKKILTPSGFRKAMWAPLTSNTKLLSPYFLIISSLRPHSS
mgnify:CR=1 FL=1